MIRHQEYLKTNEDVDKYNNNHDDKISIKTPSGAYPQTPDVGAVEIDLGCFQQCQNLSEAYLPNVGIVNDSTFAGCTKLKTVDVHGCSIIGDYAFYQCTSLNQISLPNVEIYKVWQSNLCRWW